jgi:hypothetical protein
MELVYFSFISIWGISMALFYISILYVAIKSIIED